MTDQKPTIAVHGLGYVGLTAAIHWAKAGCRVVAYDPDETVVEALREGRPKAGEFLGYLGKEAMAYVEGYGGYTLGVGEIHPTTSFDDTLACDVHSIAVPTERAGVPDMSIVEAVLLRLFDQAKTYSMILVESTLEPGTIDRVREAYALKPLRTGLAVCPRRDWFADKEKNVATLERVVGIYPFKNESHGIVELLSHVTPREKIHVTDYRTAEVTKALENAWLHALVMLPTELALERPNLDIAEATRLASTHWRLPSIFLGAGCGGRCVPLGTRYLLGLTEAQPSLLEAVNELEARIRKQCAWAVAQRPAHRKVLVLGVAYRPNFRDAGNSPAIDIAHHLQAQGVEVHLHDSLWTAAELAAMFPGFTFVEKAFAEEYDAVVLVTPHEYYMRRISLIRGIEWDRGACRFVLDTQHAWADYASDFRAHGIEYTWVGAPGWSR